LQGGEGGWKFPELTARERSEVGSGNFQPPEVRSIPDSSNLQVCFVFITCHFGKKYCLLKNLRILVYNFLFGITNILAANNKLRLKLKLKKFLQYSLILEKRKCTQNSAKTLPSEPARTEQNSTNFGGHLSSL
jgi:hypothetical protein